MMRWEFWDKGIGYRLKKKNKEERRNKVCDVLSTLYLLDILGRLVTDLKERGKDKTTQTEHQY